MAQDVASIYGVTDLQATVADTVDTVDTSRLGGLRGMVASWRGGTDRTISRLSRAVSIGVADRDG
jgi:hypothetical protein